MPQLTNETPLLADNEHEEQETQLIRVLSANDYFKRPLKIITAFISILSISVLALIIATYGLIRNSSFSDRWYSEESLRDVAIVLLINLILVTPTIIISYPIVLNIASQIAMSIVILWSSSNIFGDAWPDEYTCRFWSGPGNGYGPEGPRCRRARTIMRITMGISGGVGISIGLLLLAILSLRVVALGRTKFWNKIVFPSWNPAGFTVQFTFSVLPNETRRKAADAAEIGTEEEAVEAQLIET